MSKTYSWRVQSECFNLSSFPHQRALKYGCSLLILHCNCASTRLPIIKASCCFELTSVCIANGLLYPGRILISPKSISQWTLPVMQQVNGLMPSSVTTCYLKYWQRCSDTSLFHEHRSAVCCLGKLQDLCSDWKVGVDSRIAFMLKLGIAWSRHGGLSVRYRFPCSWMLYVMMNPMH